MFLVALVCLSVLSVINSSLIKNGPQMTFHGGVRDSKRKKRLDFGSDSDHHVDCPIGVLSFVLFNDAWSQKGHSASNTTVTCIFASIGNLAITRQIMSR